MKEKETENREVFDEKKNRGLNALEIFAIVFGICMILFAIDRGISKILDPIEAILRIG